MKKQELVVEIDPATGQITADVKSGPGGVHCEAMIADLLGAKPTETQKKPEYYQRRQMIGRQTLKK